MEILAIDDELEVLDCLKELLQMEGHHVTIACQVQEGLDKFSSHPYDMLITDLKMPSINGKYLVELIRVKNPDIPVVVLSGNIDSEEELKIMGADMVISKPLKLEELLGFIEQRKSA